MTRRVVVLAGTNKGLFLFRADAARQAWERSGPLLSGWEVFSILGDKRGGRDRLLVGTSHAAYGPTVRLSDDFGATWQQTAASPRFPAASGRTAGRIWQLVADPSDAATIYAGTEDAGLFVSRDSGESWQGLPGLNDHPSRPHWGQGGAGGPLHSLLIDPADGRRLWAGIGGAGVFRSEDGGTSWRQCHTGLPQDAFGGIGSRLHKLAAAPRAANRLYLRCHAGMFASEDGGEHWQPIAEQLPPFGFPLAVSQRSELFIAPLAGREERYMPDGVLQLWRSRDGGASWQPCRAGLPTTPQYVSILRDSLAVDALDPPGVYFGTTAGELFASADGGDTWQQLPGQYSRITAVKTWEV